MGHSHYRVRRPRHGRPYRTTTAAGERAAPAAAPFQPAAREPGPRKEGLGVVSRHTTTAWRGLLAPDGTPPAQPLQVAYVRRAVWRETGMRPSLKGLTIGQADRLLSAVGADPAPLWRAGGNRASDNLAASATKWLVIVLLCLEFLAIGRIAGVPFILVGMAVAMVAFGRRQRRQAFEDRHYRGGAAPPRPRGRLAPTPRHGTQESDERAKPPASPYDVDEYLRRLNEDSP